LGFSKWILLVTKFAAALDAPYAVFSTGRLSTSPRLPAPEDRTTNLGPALPLALGVAAAAAASSSDAIAWNSNSGATALMAKCSAISLAGVTLALPKYFDTPAFAITTSSFVIPCCDASVDAATCASVADVLSIFTVMS